ncbi:Catalase-peroxidase [Frankliniella fusca]|uniref:Catalase-peroxidase n=1 Tax=Frankliniella fusca TaxID=407009 RepID=A0AAE1LMB8_9NEOP|nr:Catalase-peroxidase [Frankliniella fusca]
MVYCAKCRCGVHGGLEGLKTHIREEHHVGPFFCHEGQCFNGGKSFKVKSSFIRHLESNHPLSCHAGDSSDEDESMDLTSSSHASTLSRGLSCQSNQRDSDARSMGSGGGDVGENHDDGAYDEDREIEVDDEVVPDDFTVKLEKSAALFVLNVRRHGNVPGTTVEYIMKETFKLMTTVISAAQETISTYLKSCNIGEEIISKPEPKFLGTRWDDRLDKQTGLTLPVQVRTTFMYVSLIDQLKAVVNNPVLLELIHRERPSTDGHYRSFLDGSVAKSHPLILKFPNIIRLGKWMDDSEVVNPLGSKTSIHKIVNDLFTILNLPPEENARLRSIHLSSYSYREDLCEEETVDTILVPFFRELEQLESEDGVQTTLSHKNNEPFTLRATLTGFSADDLAAHELLGLCSPSSNRFCTLCLITRHEFHINIFAMGALRTKEMHNSNIEELRTRGRAYALASSAVKRVSILIKAAKYIEFPSAMIRDPMHDLLRGIAPMEIKLVLHELCVSQNYFSIEDFNAQLQSFNYGPADMKNKPSANITRSSLQQPFSYVLHQTAAQAWCLLRVFPFLVRKRFPKVPQNCPHLDLLVLLKRICDIVFSNDISEDDLLLLEQLIQQHHSIFISLYPPSVHQAPEDENNAEEDFLDGNEEDVDDPQFQPLGTQPAGSRERAKSKNQKVVRPLQKHHALLHYKQIITQYGPIVLFWCMRFEAKNALLKRYGAICNNFIRLPLSFANIHQMSHAADFLDFKCSVKDEISYSRGTLKAAASVQEFPALSDLGMQEDTVLLQVLQVTVGGFKYIVGLHVTLPLVIDGMPIFGKITNIYISEEQPFLICEDLVTICYDVVFGAYRIENKLPEQTVRAYKPSSLPPVRPMTVWLSADNNSYLSPRNAIGDMLINFVQIDENE